VQHTLPAQGATVERAQLLVCELDHAHGTYVGLTRARGPVHLVASHELLDAETADRGDERPDALGRLAAHLGRPDPAIASIEQPLARTPRGEDVEAAETRLHEEPTAGRGAPEDRVGAARESVHVPDPLDRFRDVLGERRAAQLPEVKATATLETAGADELQAARAARQDAVDRFPAREAFELRRIERDRAIAGRERSAVERELAALREQRAILGVLRRSERQRVDAQIEVRERALAELDRRLQTLQAREDALREDGRHPDQWLERDARAPG
jgi:hypothetical protein